MIVQWKCLTKRCRFRFFLRNRLDWEIPLVFDYYVPVWLVCLHSLCLLLYSFYSFQPSYTISPTYHPFEMTRILCSVLIIVVWDDGRNLFRNSWTSTAHPAFLRLNWREGGGITKLLLCNLECWDHFTSSSPPPSQIRTNGLRKIRWI